MERINTIDTNRIKFEARTPPSPEPRRSAFWGILQGLGLVATPVAIASGAFFPPGLLIGAAAYGTTQFAGYKNQVKAQEGMPTRPPAVFYPGINTPVGGPAGFTQTNHAMDPMNVIENRQIMQLDTIRQVK